jgi:hypothetical protein
VNQVNEVADKMRAVSYLIIQSIKELLPACMGKKKFFYNSVEIVSVS